MSVVIYTTPTCGFCHQVKAYLNRRGVPFVERDLSRDPQAAAEMVRLSGQQGVPVTVIDGQVVLGANMPQIDQLLAQRAADRVRAAHPPKLGVSIAASERIAAKKGIQLPTGAYVGRVTPGTAGALAGLRTGDVILQLAGQQVRNDQDVHAIMSRQAHGQSADLLAWRNGQTIGMRVMF
jgi:glutaredoxin-like YruB-family protein